MWWLVGTGISLAGVLLPVTASRAKKRATALDVRFDNLKTNISLEQKLAIHDALEKALDTALSPVLAALKETGTRVHGIELEQAKQYGGNSNGMRQKLDAVGSDVQDLGTALRGEIAKVSERVATLETKAS